MMKYWFSLLITAFLIQPAWGQEDTGPEQQTEQEAISAESSDTVEAAPSNGGGRVEKIEVTGSHIKRVDTEGPSPVVTFDRDYLDRTGYNSVADVLRDTTVAGLGGLRETGLNGGALTGAATTSVRGMDADSILVLLDGRRLPTIGGSTQVDLNLIPMAAIERVEILKDGASAIYGSDALGGVINFITKKDYDGINLSLGHQQPELAGGARSDITGTYGKSGSNYNFLGVLQYRTNQPIAMRQRDFAIPTEPFFSPTGSPGSWKNHADDEKSWKTNITGGDPCTGPKKGTGKCAFDYSPYMNILPEIDQFSTLLRGEYEISESLKVFGRAIATRRKAVSILAPAPDGFEDEREIGGLDTRVPKAVADAWGIPSGSTTVNGTDPGKDVDVVYRLVEEGGSRVSEVVSDSVGVTTGVKGYYGDTWDWEVSVNYAQSNTVNTGISGFANKSLLRDAAIADPNSFNPFAPSGSKANIDFARYQPVQEIFSNIGGVLMKGSGEVYELKSGPIALAVGVMTNWQTYEENNDEVTLAGSQWGGGTSASGYGRRDFQSAYTEFSIPILKNLEVQAAGRFDNFSDFGSTVNPKLGFRYKPLKSLMFRGSWGTGFKAPALEDLYASQNVSFPFAYDPIADQVEQFETQGGGNPNLKEETSESLNLGFVWQILDSLSFGTDYYINNQNDVVKIGATTEGLRDVFRAEQAGIDLSQFGYQVIRNPAGTGAIERIVAPTLNLARRETQGLEFRLQYGARLFGDWSLNSILDYSLLLGLRELPFPGMAMEERIGFNGNPYFRSNLSINMSNTIWGINALIRTIGEQNFSASEDVPGTFGKTRDHTELDLQAQYNASWDATISFGIRNVFNTDRPLQREHQSNGFLDTDLYDPFGRTAFVNYSQNF